MTKYVFTDSVKGEKYSSFLLEKDEEKLVVHFGVSGDDIPMQFVLVVDGNKEVIEFSDAIGYIIVE